MLASNTSNLLARYAAADVSPGAQRGRAMGLIVWGSTLGSILGPNLMAPALRVGDALGIAPTASAFLISVAGYALAALVVEALLRPDPLLVARRLAAEEVEDGPAAPARALGAILGDVRVQIAIATLMISQLVMIATTSTSPCTCTIAGTRSARSGWPCRSTSAACTARSGRPPAA